MISEIGTSFRYKRVMALASFLLVSPVAFAALQETKFLAVNLNPGTVLNAVEDAGSLRQCALRCPQQSCDSAASPCCTLFCWSKTSLACYVQTTSRPYKQLLPSAVGFRCFVKEELSHAVALGYQMTRGRCVKMYEEKKRRSDAQTRCAADGGHLYYFKTKGTDEPVFNDVTGTLAAPTGRYWVGAKEKQDGTHRWEDGTLLAFNASVWLSGEPNNENDNEKCVEVITEDSNETWFNKTASHLPGLNDLPCDTMLHFICQVDV